MTPDQLRSEQARLAAHISWANTERRAARTAAARKAAEDRWTRQVDPDGVMDPVERAKRAENAKQAHMARMRLARAKNRKTQTPGAAEPTPSRRAVPTAPGSGASDVSVSPPLGAPEVPRSRSA